MDMKANVNYQGATMMFRPFENSVNSLKSKAFRNLLKQVFWEEVKVVKDSVLYDNALVRDKEGNIFWANKDYLGHDF